MPNSVNGVRVRCYHGVCTLVFLSFYALEQGNLCGHKGTVVLVPCSRRQRSHGPGCLPLLLRTEKAESGPRCSCGRASAAPGGGEGQRGLLSGAERSLSSACPAQPVRGRGYALPGPGPRPRAPQQPPRPSGPPLAASSRL